MTVRVRTLPGNVPRLKRCFWIKPEPSDQDAFAKNMLLFCENEVKVCSFTLENIETVAEGRSLTGFLEYSDVQTPGQTVGQVVTGFNC